MAGLDPAIHTEFQNLPGFVMDHRNSGSPELRI
jgi:hypothetical protein